MILVPELETVVLLVPRTGSGSLRRAIAKRWPSSVLLYRHMEADGVPAGYDRWRRVGIARHPIERWWSLYKFLKGFDAPHSDQGPEYREAQVRSVSRSFEDWVLNNETVFTSPYDSAGLGRFYPQYTVRHPLPENRKSQFLYLRPDLGTEVWRYDQLNELAKVLDLDLSLHNATTTEGRPPLSSAVFDYVRRGFLWDVEASIGPSCMACGLNTEADPGHAFGCPEASA